MTESPHPVRILVRLSGELATKSRQTRRRFQRLFIEALEDALRAAGTTFRIRSEWGRLLVEASDRSALDVLSRVFGVASFSEIDAIARPDLDAIIATGERIYAERVRGGTFGVRARRAGRHPFTSRDINYGLGTALNRYAEVDLDDPDLWIGVEVRADAAYLFSEKLAGAGGLPAGVEGRALALISGGYDSAVAAWMMMRRGVAVDFLFCNLGGGAYERAVLAVAKALADEWGCGTRPTMHVVDFEGCLRELRARVAESYWQVILKRLMYRAAERVAAETAALAIVTGESVGQVSSQTLPNIAAIDVSVTVPVLRPLVGSDKAEIIETSRRIGTYALSEKVREYCSLTERRPVTDASIEAADREEGKLDLGVVQRAVDLRRTLDLRSLDSSELVMPYLYTAEIPAAAVVIDTRSAARYDSWHYPGAVRHDFWELYRDFARLDRDVTHVLYCDLGLRSAQLAEKMQAAGFEAYSFKGGVKALREYAGADGLQPA